MCVCVYRAQQNNGSVCALYILSQRGTKRIDIAQHELALWRACHGWKLSYDRNFTILGEMNKYLFCWMVDVREWESEREKATRLNGSGRAMSFEQKEIFTNAFEFNLLSILMAILSDGFKFGWAITQLHTSAHWSADASTKSRMKKELWRKCSHFTAKRFNCIVQVDFRSSSFSCLPTAPNIYISTEFRVYYPFPFYTRIILRSLHLI